MTSNPASPGRQTTYWCSRCQRLIALALHRPHTAWHDRKAVEDALEAEKAERVAHIRRVLAAQRAAEEDRPS